eukprot:EG_transcript_25353
MRGGPLASHFAGHWKNGGKQHLHQTTYIPPTQGLNIVHNLFKLDPLTPPAGGGEGPPIDKKNSPPVLLRQPDSHLRVFPLKWVHLRKCANFTKFLGPCTLTQPSDVNMADGEIGALVCQTGWKHTPAVTTNGTGADVVPEPA